MDTTANYEVDDRYMVRNMERGEVEVFDTIELAEEWLEASGDPGMIIPIDANTIVYNSSYGDIYNRI